MLGASIAIMLVFMSITSDLLSIAECIVSFIAVAVCILTYESVTTTFDHIDDELVITRKRIFGERKTIIEKSAVKSVDRMQKGTKKKKPFITTIVSYEDDKGELNTTCPLIIKDFMFSDEDDGELYKALVNWKLSDN